MKKYKYQYVVILALSLYEGAVQATNIKEDIPDAIVTGVSRSIDETKDTLKDIIDRALHPNETPIERLTRHVKSAVKELTKPMIEDVDEELSRFQRWMRR